ncbi:lipopolysaccharide heptosyltransferase I [Hydrogenimonas urashimensis]|uniref:lipopolysaccharide heptosyltransferase I n=1 Tax=Hydrogenimonas urashimensis TaxID=2740515 RepID=UPI001915B440|nr:lipopolysaccharide heptosyltransferase I [Hydrogenimonas urashimensis]
MRVAIVRLTAMGDVIHTLASLQFVKEKSADIELTWFVEEKFAPILFNNPDIDHVVPLNLHSLKEKLSFDVIGDIYKKIKRAGPFDLVIDVQGLIKSAIVAKIAGQKTAGLDRNSAKEGIASFFYRHRYRVDCANIAPVRFASLIAQALGMEITREMLLKKKPYLFFDKGRIDTDIDTLFSKKSRNVLVVTAASNASKTYPAERFVELIEELRDHNVLLIAGSAAERREAEEIARNSHATLLPAMDLNTLKYAVGRCDLLIGGDTGPSHIAWAMNKPSILLFGATPKTMMMETPVNVAITSGMRVHPCRFDKGDRSIATIPPEKVAETAQRLLA